MNEKRFVNIIVIIGILMLIGIVSYFIMSQKTSLSRPTRSPVPSPISTPTPITDTSRCDIKPDESGRCPEGCINYGVPLGCVTQKYYEECESGNKHCPICLAGNSLIETPLGLVLVKNLRVGMSIWTTDKSGRRVSGVVIQTAKVPVPASHQMIHLVLDDGRELVASPGHPITDGRNIDNLTPNELYDGASVVSTRRIPYDESATYDILPSGETGFYWANGVLLGSTLSRY